MRFGPSIPPLSDLLIASVRASPLLARSALIHVTNFPPSSCNVTADDVIFCFSRSACRASSFWAATSYHCSSVSCLIVSRLLFASFTAPS